MSRYHPRCFHQGICLDIDRHITVRRTHLFGQGIIGAMPIELSEPNSHSYPRLLFDANQIKWFKIHILLLDFDWCPIEVTITLHIICTSIGNLRWIALSPHSSLMKRKAFHLRRGWVERNSFPSGPELRIVHTAHRVTYSLSFMGPWTFSLCSEFPCEFKEKLFENNENFELSLPKHTTSSRNPSWP